MEKTYQYAEKDYKIIIQRQIQDYLAIIDNQQYEVTIIHNSPGSLTICINVNLHQIYYALNGFERWISLNGQTFCLQRKTASRAIPISPREINTGTTLYSPMPGQIRAIEVSVGDRVNTGQTLVILEAMKMEIRVQSSRPGIIEKIHVSNREIVEKDQLLIELEQPDTSEEAIGFGG